MISKIIHYCWLSNDPVPKELQKYMKSWREKLPEYEFILWNFDRFDINSSLWVKQAFEHKKYAFAADYIRLFAVYNYGGFYMDMDVEVKKTFNDLLSNPYIFGMESPDLIEAGIFGAEKGNKLIAEVLNYYTNREFILSDGKFDIKSLPNIFHEVLSSKYVITSANNPNAFSKINHLYLYPMDYFTARDWPYRNYSITNNTYTIHHFAASWIPLKYKKKEIVKKLIRKLMGTKFLEITIDLKNIFTKD